MTLDSHQHFWRYDAAQYPWIPPGSPLQRDWLPEHLGPLLAGVGLEGCIAVQARQTIEESRWLLALADAAPIIKGVVGWVDLRSERVGGQLAELAQHRKFVGVRHVVQDEPDVNFMLGAEFQRGIGELHAFGLTYDLLILPKQLPAAIELVRKFPQQAFVLDHLAKPFIKDGTVAPWREHLRELAQAGNVTCKVSGMVTEARHDGWKADDLNPYLDTVFEAFGAARLMFGSDWPVCLLAASYEQVFRLVDDFLRQLPARKRLAVLGATAEDFYLRRR